MGAADPIQALAEVPGRVFVDVVGPFTSPAVAPFGGTELGLLIDVAWAWAGVYLRHTAEELQVKVVGSLFRGEALSMSMALRGLDNDALGVVFPASREGTTSQHRVVFGPGATTSPDVLQGDLIEEVAGRARPLLFLPDDELNHDAVLFPLAVPQIDDDPKALRLGEDHLVQVTWLALPAGNNLAYEVGRVVDLTAP